MRYAFLRNKAKVFRRVCEWILLNDSGLRGWKPPENGGFVLGLIGGYGARRDAVPVGLGAF